MPAIATFHCCVSTPMAKVSMPIDAAQRSPVGIFSGSPEGDVTVANVTVFSASERANRYQPIPTVAIFQSSAGNLNAA